MIYGSVCSGIEAATVAWHPLGWTPAWFSEIEKFTSAVLAHRFPTVPNLGDMTKIHERPEFHERAIDLLVGGTPCQGFSIAGLRKGLDDPRSQLSLTFAEIAARKRPRWVVWENVPGVLSSNGGRDFAEFLGLLCGRKIHPPANGWGSFGVIPGYRNAYGLAWRVLDAQYFGLAQRRARVFALGYLGDWRPAAAVLFERESLRGNPPPRREKGEGVAGTIEASLGRSRGAGTPPGALTAGSHWDGEDVHPTLNQSHNAGGVGQSNQEIFSQRGAYLVNGEIAGAVSRKWAKGTGGPAGDECYNLVATTLRGEGHDASEDGTGRQNLIPIAFSSKDYGNDATNDLAPTLRAMGHSESHANAGGQLAVAYTLHGADKTVSTASETDLAGAVRTKPPGSIENSSTTVALSIRGREGGGTIEMGGDCANALRASQGGGDKPHVLTKMAVRRLTEIECERLQGFPDGWTDIRPKGKPTPGGPRYKALGNSMAVPVMRWIGERIEMVETLMNERTS